MQDPKSIASVVDETSSQAPLVLGALETAIRITKTDGVSIETVTTPRMWAVADEFVDRLRITGKHSEPWIIRKLQFAIHMQAAQAEGVFEDKLLTLESIAEFLNECEVVELPSKQAPKEKRANVKNPTLADPESSQATSSAKS